MTLVDTSVWIRFLRNQAPHAAELDRLRGRDAVTGHELIFGELLIGDAGGRAKLLSAYQHMHQAAMIPHWEVVAFVRHRGLHGCGLGWIDAHLVASAVIERLDLWTADRHLAAAAGELGIAYTLPA